jgi:hypothetical protein
MRPAFSLNTIWNMPLCFVSRVAFVFA